MPAQGIRSSKPTSTTPLHAGLQLAFAHELFLARVKALVSLAIVLTRE